MIPGKRVVLFGFVFQAGGSEGSSNLQHCVGSGHRGSVRVGRGVRISGGVGSGVSVRAGCVGRGQRSGVRSQSRGCHHREVGLGGNASDEGQDGEEDLRKNGREIVSF